MSDELGLCLARGGLSCGQPLLTSQRSEDVQPTLQSASAGRADVISVTQKQK